MIVKAQQKSRSLETLKENLFTSPQVLDLFATNTFPLSVGKFIALLAMNLNEQRIHNKKQLSLFDNEWLAEGRPYVLQFNGKYKDFLPKGSKNYKQVKDALRMLANTNTEVSYTVEIDGKKHHYKLTSTIISNYVEELHKGFKCTINAHWYRAFVNVEVYKKMLLQTVLNIQLPHAWRMYVFLITLADNLPFDEVEKFNTLFKTKLLERQKKTKIRIENFQRKFGVNYTGTKHLITKLLDPVRQHLNDVSEISFNYRIENGLIYIISYDCYSINNSYLDSIKKAIMFRIKDRQLDYSSAVGLAELYLKYGYKNVSSSINRKKQLNGLVGEEYIMAVSALVDRNCDFEPVEIQQNRKYLRDIINEHYKY